MIWSLVGLCLLIAGWLLFEKLIHSNPAVNEPPFIPALIPYFGHVLGMLREGSRYYSKISARYNLPIYSLKVPGGQIYVVNFPGLIAAVDRKSKAITFGPFIPQFAKRVLVVSPEAVNALEDNMDEEKEGYGCRSETIETMQAAMAPGPCLEEATQDALQSFESLLDYPLTDFGDKTLSLFSWTRKIFTRASTDAIYGVEKNPFKDSSVADGLWAFDKNLAMLGVNIIPKFLAPQAFRGRNTVIKAFTKYYAIGCPPSASKLVQARYEVNRKHKITIEDIAHFDLGLCYGLLVNTVPAASWALFYVYSNVALLSELREQFSHYLQVSPNLSERPVYRVDVGEIALNCPLVSSIVQETLRLQTTGTAARIVLQDTTLEDRYLLKKGSVLLMPSAEIHRNISVWGDTCKEFDPRRFMQSKAEESKIPSFAFRPFGRGAAYCPGRFLAMNEIVTIVVIMVLRYDMDPLEDKWNLPATYSHLTTSVPSPVEDVPIRLSKRKGYENCEWSFSWSGAKSSSASLSPSI